MFWPKVFVTAKLKKTLLVGLGIVAFLVAHFTLGSKTDSGKEKSPCTTLEGFGKPVNALAFSPDGKTLATGDGWLGRKGEVKLWDLDAGIAQTLVGEFPNAILSLAFNPNGRIMAIGCYDGSVRLWDLVQCQESHVVRNSEIRPYRAAFSPDGRILATWGSNDCLQLRDLSTGDEQILQEVRGPVVFCPDDHPLGLARFHNVTICDALKNQRLLNLAPNTHLYWTITFSPDGRTVAAASQDGRVTLWDGNTGQERLTIAGHPDRVNILAFSPDGKTLASGAFHGAVKLWAVDTGEELACFQGHTRAVAALAFAADGQKIASGSHDQTVRIWALDNGSKKIGR